jgi:hypothetical protein
MAPAPLSPSELDGQTAEVLPERSTMAWINVHPVTAVNIAIAVNAATIHSQAVAIAHQAVH